MAVAKRQHHRMTVAKFLDWSKDDPQRYELVHGEVFAMAPGLLIHHGLAGRLGRALGSARWESRREGLDAALRPEDVPLEPGLADPCRDIEFETEFSKGQPVAAGGH